MSLTSDERAWLIRIEEKIDHIILNGCAKAPLHTDHETRLREIESTIQQGRGFLHATHILSAVIGGCLSFFASKLWK
jgi:hypothetical protein